MALGDYTKTTYNEGAAPGISAERLNKNENKTKELDDWAETHEADDTTAHGIDTKANKAQEAWTTQTLLNGWKQAYQIGYFKDEFGFVHLRGEIYNGTKTVGTTLFTLSDGYRPGSFKVFATSTTGSDGTTVQIQSLTIDTSGNVKIAVKSALTYIVLENISFKV